MEANRTSCASALRPLFEPYTATPRSLDVSDVALHALPACATLALWILVESSRSRRGLPRSFGRVAVAVALSAAAASTLCVWRTFELLGCDDTLPALDGWRWPVTIGVALAQVLVSVALGPRFVRLGTLSLLAAAAATLVAEWALATLADAAAAALSLVAVQQLACLQAVALLAHLPAPRTVIATARAPVKSQSAPAPAQFVELDALARRPVAGGYPADRHGSWFS